MTLLWHEVRRNGKSLLIWACSVGLLSAGCLLLFQGLEESMGEMSEAFANMGMFATVLGMDKLSIGTMEGFYATEIALLYAIGGAMFAAMTGVALLSKEEEGHTSEFLHTLPLGRAYIVGWKYASLVVLVVSYNALCLAWILLGFEGAGQMPPVKEFACYHGVQLLMHLEVGSVCYLASSLWKRRQTGAALGFAMLLYVADLLCRILPDMEGLKYVTPFYFSNGTDIFVEGRADGGLLLIAGCVILVSVLGAVAVYRRRDLAA